MKKATDKQIAYLQTLADKVETLKLYFAEKQIPSNISKTPYINWEYERYLGVTTEDASLRINAYREIIFNAKLILKLLNK